MPDRTGGVSGKRKTTDPDDADYREEDEYPADSPPNGTEHDTQKDSQSDAAGDAAGDRDGKNDSVENGLSNDKNKNGRWVWISGEDAVYRNWAPRQPSGGTEDCGEITLYKLRFPGADPGIWNGFLAEEGAQRGIVERNGKPSTSE